VAQGDDLQKILDLAKRRSKHATRKSFPRGIIKHGERTIAWFEHWDIPWNLGKFKHMFIHFGQVRLGTAEFIHRVVPIIYTDEEFVSLLTVMGYDVMDEDEEEEEVDLRVLVCGSRDWDDAKFINRHLRQLPRGTTIIEGAARGADSIAAQAAEHLGFEIEEYPAEWKKYDKAAGHIRNQQMLDEGKPDVVIAFSKDIYNSKGTLNMVKRAKKAGLPIKILSGSKNVDIEAWLDEVLEFE